MSEIEVPTEHLHEELHHAAHGGERWISFVALSSALLAALAAVAALMAGHHVNEATLARIQSSDQWSYFQAKGVKAAVLGSKMEMLSALGKKASEKDEEKLKEYKAEQQEIQEKAKHLEHESEAHLASHTRLAGGVTMFQIAIALGAISALTRRRPFWYVSLLFGVVGIAFLALGVGAGGH
ncbi:MAG: DUF4337 domain-containing protein [Elusimicrobia bacterium]|nr:DUF4337 domain-containing protein [Elusimicrobiota bacterium]